MSMIPTLLSFVKENRSYADTYSIFEIGHTVDGLRENGTANERKKLGVVLYSRTTSEETLSSPRVMRSRRYAVIYFTSLPISFPLHATTTLSIRKMPLT